MSVTSKTIIISKANLAFVDQAFVSAMNFLTGLALARFLGLKGYGEYVLVYGVILFFSTVQVSLIVSPMMVKGPAVEESDRRKYFSAVAVSQFLFSVVSAGLIIVVGLVVVWAFRFHQFDPFIVPLAVATAVFLAQDYYRRYFFVIERPVAALTSDIIGYGVQFAIILVFGIMGNLDADGVLWAMAFAFFLGASLVLVQSGRKRVLELGERSYLRKVCRENYDFGKWLLGVNMMYWGQAQIINYFVAAGISVAAVGALNACKNVLGVLNVFFLGLQNVLLPEASRAFADGGQDVLGKYLKRVAMLGGLITFLVVLVAAVWNEYWVRLFYGSQYDGYGWIVIWWGIYFFVAFFHRPYSAGLSVIDKTKLIFQSMIVGFGSFVVLGYPAIIFWKIHGIMFLMCLSNLVALMLLGMNLTREFRNARSSTV